MTKVGIVALSAITAGLAGGAEPKPFPGAVTCDAEAAAVPDDLARFQGTWQLLAAETNGTQAPDERVKSIRLMVRGNTHTVRIGDQVIAHDVRFAIDPSKTPKEVTDTIGERPDKGKEIRGIYNLVGDTLVSCVAPAGKDRPTEFNAREGTGWTLRVFRRLGADDARREPAIADELRKFAGTWRMTQMETDGRPAAEETFRDVRLTLQGAHFTVSGPRGILRGVCSIDPTAKLKTIDIVFTDGTQNGNMLLGVYAMEGDTYRVCVATGGNPRPSELASKAGSGHVYEVLRREQP